MLQAGTPGVISTRYAARELALAGTQGTLTRVAVVQSPVITARRRADVRATGRAGIH